MTRNSFQENQNLCYTNFKQFYQIAQKAHSKMHILLSSSIRPKPDGEKGNIITFDSDQKSFKNALITIIFCGICLESFLHIRIFKDKGKKIAKDSDCNSYEKKLQLLGCTDESIIHGCGDFRKIRREIVHEKAFFDDGELHIAQDEAGFAMKLIDDILDYFNVPLKGNPL